MNIFEVYKKEINNRYIIHSDVQLSKSKFFNIKCFVAIFIFLLKWLISFILISKNKVDTSSDLAISWSRTHNKRLEDLTVNFKPVYYDFKSIKKEQIFFFKRLNQKGFYRNLFLMLNGKIERNDRGKLFFFDSYAYRILFVLEYCLFKGILEGYKCNNIYIAGLNDRYAIMITDICQNNDNMKLHMLQHGLLADRKGLSKVIADFFYYLYDFSFPFIKNAVDVHQENCIKLSSKKKNSINDFFLTSKENIVAIATSIAYPSTNFSIIDIIVKHLDKTKYDILIYPHPLEDIEAYKAKYSSNQHIFYFKRERHRNIDLVISQCSTMGVEYYNIGVESLFINVHGFNFDIAHAPLFQIFNKLNDFEEYIKN